ncbi:MAG: two-component sensor histidine kinase [Comamonadaceae bacterium CG12_big_fil_rev_8_21_14_0_65_59_15]|nr:MAG: two-component sensor histidine kinase [Comamonadaceae bacterium CG12_big_fil_rev_8_21_14_0_65_59_15]
MTETSPPEYEVSQLQRQLDAARAEIQEFTYAVSHDLRAPLRHINAFAQVLEEDWPDMPADAASHLATIRQSAQLLASQLDGLTQLSRLNLHPLNLQTVDVSALAQDVANEVAARYPQQTVQWQLATDVPPVTADSALLRQVLLQVLDNAVKFSRGRDPASVGLRWQWVDAQCCQITVRDHGVGFAPGQAQALFKAFGKLHPAREFAGLGLGLVSCRKIMQRFGGTIDLQAVADGGCCVTLQFDLKV